MTGPTHVVVGFASSFALAKAIGLPLDLFSLLAVLLGALAPDIDGDGAITRPGRLFRNFVPRPIGIVIDFFTELFTETLERIFGHRGFFHWPVLGIAIATYGWMTDSSFLFWFGWAYVSHILADALTVQGVPLLAPITRADFSVGFCRTGSMLEGVFAVFAFCVMVWNGFFFLPPSMQTEIRHALPDRFVEKHALR